MIGIRGIAKKPITDATAVPGDVMSGKTFYGKDGKQTGTLQVLSQTYGYGISDIFTFDDNVDDYLRQSASYIFILDDILYALTSQDRDYVHYILTYNIKLKKWTKKYIASEDWYHDQPYVAHNNVYVKKRENWKIYKFDPNTLEAAELFFTSTPISSCATMFGDFYWNTMNAVSYSPDAKSTLSKLNEDESQTVVQTNLPFAQSGSMLEFHKKIHMCFCTNTNGSNNHYMLENGVLTQLSSMTMSSCRYIGMYDDQLIIMGNKNYIYNESDDSWTEIVDKNVESDFSTITFFQYNEKLYATASKGPRNLETYAIYEVYKKYIVRK